MASLKVLNRDEEIPLRAKVTFIGRDPVSDLVVNTSQTSWRHALILHSGNQFFVEDLDSVNGTFVNGRRIAERKQLQNQDRIDVCGLSVVFNGDAQAVSVAEQTATMPAPPQDPPSSILSTLAVDAGQRLEVKSESKLRALLEISRQLSTALDLRDVLPKILQSLFTVFSQADRGFILLMDPNTGQLVPRAMLDHRSADGNRPAISRAVINEALSTGRAILSADVGTDARFDLSQSVRGLQICSMMCVPMLAQNGRPLGVIQIETRERANCFRDDDLAVLVCASTEAARAVELAQLHQDRRELEAATQIQKSFLPRTRPHVPGLSFFDYYASAHVISGDYYDYIALPGHRLVVGLGDVSGKGVAAALVMARLSAAARFAFASEKEPTAALRGLNLSLMQTHNDDRFITFVAAIVDKKTYSMTLLNAGHPPPLRKRKGTVEDLEPELPGLPLAVTDQPYESATLSLEPGDVIVLFTDGVTEARNQRNELYGIDRLRAIVKNTQGTPTAMGEAILNDVQRFAGGRPASDDLTLVCFGRE